MKIKEVIPREHGAWAMWIAPMLSAVLISHFSLSFIMLFTCFALLYIVHHPIVALAKRGWKWRDGEKALVAAFAGPAVLLGAGLVLFYDLPWLLLFGWVELVLFLFSVKTYLDREQRTFLNELAIVASLTLSAPAAYYAITGSLDAKAFVLYLLNFLFFGSSVFYVKMRIEFLRMKGVWSGPAASARNMALAYHALLLAAVIAIMLHGRPEIFLFAGFAPMLAQVAAGLFSKRTKVNFTRLGVALVVQSVVFLSAVGLFFRYPC